MAYIYEKANDQHRTTVIYSPFDTSFVTGFNILPPFQFSSGKRFLDLIPSDAINEHGLVDDDNTTVLKETLLSNIDRDKLVMPNGLDSILEITETQDIDSVIWTAVGGIFDTMTSDYGYPSDPYAYPAITNLPYSIYDPSDVAFATVADVPCNLNILVSDLFNAYVGSPIYKAIESVRDESCGLTIILSYRPHNSGKATICIPHSYIIEDCVNEGLKRMVKYFEMFMKCPATPMDADGMWKLDYIKEIQAKRRRRPSQSED